MTDKDFLFGGGGLGGRTKTWDAWSDENKKAKVYKKYKVYLTTLDDGRFYIGYSGRCGKAFDRYFGSGKVVKSYKGKMTKKVLYSYDKITHAKFKEMLLQIKHMKNPKCLNKKIQIKMYIKNLQDFDYDKK